MTSEKKYIFELPIKVRDYEVDSEGIVNNAIYLHYLEHTRHEFCNWAGLSFRDMHNNGIDPVVSRAEIDYKTPLGLGEEMISKLNISRRGPVFIFEQDIDKADGTPVVRAKISIACIEHGRLTRGDALAEAFKKFL